MAESEDIVYGTFWQVELEDEGIVNFPASEFSVAEVMALTGTEINSVTGYFGNIGDPPQWIGPFDDEDELVSHICEVTGL